MNASSLWTREELQARVDAYVAMWRADRASHAWVKAKFLADLLSGPLRARTKGAIGYRLANISAVMVDLGHPFLTGYVPAANVGPTNTKVIRDMLVEAGLGRAG